MLELRTVYPYDLNDRLGDEYKKMMHLWMRVINFHLHPENATWNSLSPGEFIIKLKHDFVKCSLLFQTIPLAMNKCNLTYPAVLLKDNLNNNSNSLYFQCYSALDIIDFKIFKPPISKAKRKAATNIVKLSFQTKLWNSSIYPVFFIIRQRRNSYLLIPNLMILLLSTHLLIQ